MNGTMVECLRDFLDKHKTADTDQMLADFCGVKPPAVARWRRKGPNLRGEEMIRAKVFLAMVGYKPSDFVDLWPPLQQLHKMIAFGVITSTQLQEELSYSNTQNLYRILRGEKTDKHRQYRITRCVVGSDDSIDLRRRPWLERWEKLQKGLSSTDEVRPREQRPTKPTLAPGPAAGKTKTLKDPARGQSEDVDIPTAKIMAHLIDAMGALVAGRRDDQALIEAVAVRTGHKQLRAAHSLLGAVLEQTKR